MYENTFKAHENILKLKAEKSELEETNSSFLKQQKVDHIDINRLTEQITSLKSKNSRILQENWLLNRFLSSKPGEARDYMSMSNENISKENESLKQILSKQVPYNEELACSLSFYRIQYHLLKKKFSNISLATQNKNMAALEESLADAQKQLLEGELYSQHVGAPIDQTIQILLEQVCDGKFEAKQLNEQLGEVKQANDKLRTKIDLSKDVLNNYESTIEKLHREIEYLKIKNSVPDTSKFDHFKPGFSDDGTPLHTGRVNPEDKNVVQKLLNNIETLKKTVREQCDELAMVNYENDKLLNLYQNKEKVLNDKRNDLVQLQVSYDDLQEQYNLAGKLFLKPL